MRRIPGAPSLFVGNFRGIPFHTRETKIAAKKYLFLSSLILLWAGAASAQEQDTTPPPPTQSQEPPAQGVFPTPPPLAVARPEAPPPPASPVRFSNPSAFAQAPLPAALAPAIETRMGFSTLSRASSPNTRILFKGINASITGQASERFGATFETAYLRASNVFGTGHSNSVLTFLGGPVYYPYRRGSFASSVHVLGGAARVAGVVVLTPSTGGYLKGTVGDLAWAFGGTVEKWFTDSLAARVDIDALRTSFYNSSLKITGDYGLRATWGLTYYFGGRKGPKFHGVAGKQLE